VNEKGSSLLEVVIAMLILGLSVAVLVGGLFISRLVSDRASLRAAALQQIAAVSEELTAMPFVPCNDPNNIYPTPAPDTSPVLPKVSLTVETLDVTTNTWLPCTGSAVDAKKGVQLVIISSSVNGKVLTGNVVKIR
jgi:Tfp pilus assembly protein PilV